MRPFSPPSSRPLPHKTLTHLQYNINLNNHQGIETIKDYILAHQVDVVTLQEVTHVQEKSFRELAEAGYRWQTYCMRRTTQEAILSRYPFVEGSVRCAEHQGFVSAQIQIEERRLTVASIHLFLPFPYGQSAQVLRLEKAFASLASPVVLAGDFNAAPWSQTVKSVEQFSHTHVVPGLRMTIPTDYHRKPYVPLPIDQVLVSSDLQVESIATAPHMGSDHWPVISKIGY
jgi:endonuclease/exonuclease/phosphatase (EEP) superfamily protein YafD